MQNNQVATARKALPAAEDTSLGREAHPSECTKASTPDLGTNNMDVNELERQELLKNVF